MRLESDELSLLEDARGADKRAIARLVTRFEDDRPEAAVVRQRLLAGLDADLRERGRVVGFTGAPGVGKSSLVGEIAVRLIEDPAERVAVVAVDPSSPLTGGALLGDRTRVRFPPGESRLYFRSQASAAVPGGVARATHHVCRLLVRLFSTVLVETVGIGQGEIEIVRIADATFLVLQPHGGDHVQFMKAGIMEVPDAFVVSKGDLGDAATTTYHGLRGRLRLASPEADRPVYLTSARSGAGLVSVLAGVRAVRGTGLLAKEPYFFERWISAEYGRHGLRRLAAMVPSSAEFLAKHHGLDGAQAAFAALW